MTVKTNSIKPLSQVLLEGQKSEIFCVSSIPTWQCLGRKHKRTGRCNPSRTVNAGEFPSIRVVILYMLLRVGIGIRFGCLIALQSIIGVSR